MKTFTIILTAIITLGVSYNANANYKKKKQYYVINEDVCEEALAMCNENEELCKICSETYFGETSPLHP